MTRAPDHDAADGGALQPADRAGILAPPPAAQPRDHCFRCDKETPAGVGLCAEHNPKGIRAPSPTQMHATIFAGVALGIIGFFVLAGLAVGTSGPFAATVTSATLGPDGGVALDLTITNEGSRSGVPDCRVTRDGLPRPDDLAFRAGALSAGQTVRLERLLQAPPPGSALYDPERISVVCG